MILFSLLVLGVLFPSGAAFAPSTRRKGALHPIAIKVDRRNHGSTNRSPILDGTFPGDFGFDPLGFVKTEDDLLWYREAEIKHARLAMLAAVGWPLSELWDRRIAEFLDVQPAVDAAERAPSVLNGGLDRVLPGYWIACFLLGAAVELHTLRVKDKPGYFPGNLGFDPLGLYPPDELGRRYNQLAEIRNGRLAMLAVVSYALQEWVSKQAVVELTPWLFKPAWQWVETGTYMDPPY